MGKHVAPVGQAACPILTQIGRVKYALNQFRQQVALGIKEARPLVVNAGVSVVDFDHVVEQKATCTSDEIWSPADEEDNEKYEAERMALYQKQYEVVYKAPKKSVLQEIFIKVNCRRMPSTIS